MSVVSFHSAAFRATIYKVGNLFGHLGPVIIAVKRVVQTPLSRVSSKYWLVKKVDNSRLHQSWHTLRKCSIDGDLTDEESRSFNDTLRAQQAY